MVKVTASTEEAIGAPAKVVYRYLADYNEHHPRILPPAFSDFKVEKGGIGAGTIVSFKAKIGGVTRGTRGTIEEPQPGRILRERYEDREMVTTFTVTPDGKHSKVKIETTYQAASGIMGLMERLMVPRMLVKLYREELGNLDRLARTGTV